MTNMEIPASSRVDRILVAKLFARYRGRYGHLWTSRAVHDEDWEFILEDWLEELSKFSVDQVKAAVNKTLSTFKEFPPTLGQLVDLCLKESGVPSVHEVIKRMVDRDFNHPLVKMIYDKIGNWTLANAKEEEIHRKTKQYYTECLAEFHVHPEKAWNQLENYTNKLKELPPPENIPTTIEHTSLKERLSASKQNFKDKTYREFDEEAITPGHRNFDKLIYDEFRNYLLSIPEKDTMMLPPVYAYRRMRFISQKEQPSLLRKAGYNPTPQGQDNSSQNRPNGPVNVYKNWVDDS